jgi:regulator of replication initiation timing
LGTDPASVKQLVETLIQRLTQLEVEVQQIRAENQHLSAENQLLREPAQTPLMPRVACQWQPEFS